MSTPSQENLQRLHDLARAHGDVPHESPFGQERLRLMDHMRRFLEVQQKTLSRIDLLRPFDGHISVRGVQVSQEETTFFLGFRPEHGILMVGQQEHRVGSADYGMYTMQIVFGKPMSDIPMATTNSLSPIWFPLVGNSDEGRQLELAQAIFANIQQALPQKGR